jgi:hypothetical protein
MKTYTPRKPAYTTRTFCRNKACPEEIQPVQRQRGVTAGLCRACACAYLMGAREARAELNRVMEMPIIGGAK